MVTFQNQTGSKAVKISKTETGFICFHVQIYNKQEQVLETKNYVSFKSCEKWAKKHLGEMTEKEAAVIKDTIEIEEDKDNENEKELTSKELVSKYSFKTLLYCFKNEKGAVFLNRWDERIKQFETMHEALEFAKNNINLVDVKINKK